MKNEKRNILFITLSDQTGANTPLIKIANALHAQGHNVQVLVKSKNEDNPLVTTLPARNGFTAELGRVVNEDGSLTLLDRDLKYLFNTINEDNSYQDTNVIIEYLEFNPHIIFVGITFDFLTSTDILKLSEATKAVVYNAAVDMNHFTGGCHFAWDCEGYIKGCNTIDCPAVLDENYKNLASRNFLIKKENIEKGNFKILAGTEWTKKQAEKSLLYKEQQTVFNISGVVDTDIYNFNRRKTAEKISGLSKDKFYILSGAENTQDERKGFKYFAEAVNLLWDRLPPLEREQVEILLVTRIENPELYEKIKFRKTTFNYIKDERQLSLLYQSANVFVNCSVEDSGPSMLMEAMACGTPVVSFDMGAAREYVADGKSGCIVENKNTEALAESMLKIFRMSQAELLKMGETAHKLIAEKASLEQAVNTIEKILVFHQADFKKYEKSISVALCSCNGEKYIAEQLDSILNQNLKPDEIIICDDVSDDNTISILETYQKSFPEIIKIFRNETRLGVVKNFEKAINLCSKDIIFLSDQDDVWLPHKTESAVRIFNEFPEVEAICHDLRVCKEDREPMDISMWEIIGFRHFLQKDYDHKNYLFHSIFFGNIVTGAAFCMRKPAVPFVFQTHIPNVIHDYQLAINYLSKRSLYFQNECLVLYRQHENQQIGAKLRGMAHNTESVRLYYEVGNPFKNLLFIKNRMKYETIFHYLEATQDPSFEKLVRENVKAVALDSINPKILWNQVKSMFKRLEKVKGNNYKIKNGIQTYIWLIQNSFGHLFQLAKIYYVIFYSSILLQKRTYFPAYCRSFRS